MKKKKNLKRLNSIRFEIGKIKDNNKKEKFRQVIRPILRKYRNNIVSDDEMHHEIKKAIKKIKRIAVNCQYIPNNPPRPNRKNYKKPNYENHSIYKMIEFFCNKELAKIKEEYRHYSKRKVK